MNLLFIDKFVHLILHKKNILGQKHYWYNIYKRNLRLHKVVKLTRNQKKEIDLIYSSYKKVSYIYNQFYTTVTGNFTPLYMPDSLYYAYIDTFYNDWDKARYLDHKGLYLKLFPHIKQPDVIAIRMNGFWYTADYKLINVNDVIDKCRDCNIFVKVATDSSGGHGVFCIEKDNHEKLQELLLKEKNDLIIQKALKQSKVLNLINSSSVNTIRLLSLLRKDGSVKIYSSILRMGINGAKVDNASSGGITVGIHEDGRLKSIAYNAQGISFKEHPTSKVNFNDFILPNYEKVKQMVEKAATEFPFFRLVSWDIALDENDEPTLIEANFCFGELDFHQLNNGPLFGEDTTSILKEVFGY